MSVLCGHGQSWPCCARCIDLLGSQAGEVGTWSILATLRTAQDEEKDDEDERDE